MAKKSDSAAEQLATWLKKHLAKVPPKINLLGIEWNDLTFTEKHRRAGQGPMVRFSVMGFQHDPSEPFDPVDENHLDELSEPAWEPLDDCHLPKSIVDEFDPYKLVGDLLNAKPAIHPALAKLPVAYGEHEGDVKVYRPRVKKVGAKKEPTEAPIFFYELHVEGRGNFIGTYELGDFDESAIVDHVRMPGRLGKDVKLMMSSRPGKHDFLHFYRGWIVCSERAKKLFQSYTKKVQVFPAPLWYKDAPVPGYYVVNLYEKLNCLRDEDVIPADDPNEPGDFHPGRGYQIRRSVVKDKGVFRINYEHFRLVVSQAFRDEVDQQKITGLGWLKRKSVP
ncbi:DUF1629 domain-containing protein [Anatilimnocola sp. NA78]|uniref:imm11 family protein n=1 Tax=Anatilimnocola sp. NA78 TaxID=3415683 RepID=UPI003CE4E03C